LPFSVTDKELQEIFQGFAVLSAHVVVKRNGRSKGFGFVEFENVDDGNKAIEEINGTNILNRKVAVDWCLAKDYYVEYIINQKKRLLVINQIHKKIELSIT